jgi:hypothetical protein
VCFFTLVLCSERATTVRNAMVLKNVSNDPKDETVFQKVKASG